MRSQDKRLSALEAYIESRVEEGVRRELEAAFELLEERLTHEEFVRVVRILAEMGDERSRSKDSNTQAGRRRSRLRRRRYWASDKVRKLVATMGCLPSARTGNQHKFVYQDLE